MIDNHADAKLVIRTHHGVDVAGEFMCGNCKQHWPCPGFRFAILYVEAREKIAELIIIATSYTLLDKDAARIKEIE